MVSSRLLEDLLTAGQRIIDLKAEVDRLRTGIETFLEAHHEIASTAVLLPLEGAPALELQRRHQRAIARLQELIEEPS